MVYLHDYMLLNPYLRALLCLDPTLVPLFIGPLEYRADETLLWVQGCAPREP